MSALPATLPASDQVNIEIDGVSTAVPKGFMIIQAADRLGIKIPRFCYHEKLTIAANCRMCLVDVEKAPKPQPACATPVMEGMKVFTTSARSLSAQRNVMEFLLINHPLDCPICDQGGECELQDVAIGYGRGISRFVEDKRVVADENLGPLVATEMTRCIHCTRCVRFMDEIAGTTELGGMGRGETLEIGTYIGRSIRTELSGNIIDLCPVGALTNKVFRFRARPWELIARDGVGYHDSLGSNQYLHLLRGEVVRVVPRNNEAINENWLSDRDRYSHQGLYSADRAQVPRIKRGGVWQDTDWATAISFAADQLRAIVSRSGADQLGTLAGPIASAEEFLLLARVARGLGSANVDHRLRQLDFSDDPSRALSPSFAAPLSALEKAGAILLLGCNPRLDVPLLGHRVRKAFKRGAKIYALNPADFDFNFQLEHKLIGHPWAQVSHALALARAASDLGAAVSADLAPLMVHALSSDTARAIVEGLKENAPARIIFGEHAARHPQASVLRACARFVATATGASFDEQPDSANAAAAWRMGALPHRGASGAVSPALGLNARQMLEQSLRGYMLFGAEPGNDFALGNQAVEALAKAEFVLAFAHYVTPVLETLAHVILPLALPPESEGTYVNLEGRAQRTQAAAAPMGQAKPGWRILRVLGAELQLSEFAFNDYQELSEQADQVLAADLTETGPSQLTLKSRPTERGLILNSLTSIYTNDAVLRRCPALQNTVIAAKAAIQLHPEDALGIGVSQGASVTLVSTALSVEISKAVPKGSFIVTQGLDATLDLPVSGSVVNVQKR